MKTEIAVYVSILVFVFAVSFLWFESDNAIRVWNRSTNPLDGVGGEGDTTVVVVYMTAPGCSYCNRRAHVSDIKRLKDSLAVTAREINCDIDVSAIIVSGKVQRGINHISKYGNFDEISTGRLWHNSLLDEYAWNRKMKKIMVPQVAVFKTVYESKEPPIRKSKQIISTQRGTKKIREWVNNGTPVGLGE